MPKPKALLIIQRHIFRLTPLKSLISGVKINNFYVFFNILLYLFLDPNISHGQYFHAALYKDIDGLPSSRITDILQLPNHEIWFATQKGIASYDGLSWSPVGDKVALPTDGEIDLQMTQDSSIYVVGKNQKDFVINRRRNGQWSKVDLPKELIQDPFISDYRINPTNERQPSKSLDLIFRNKIYHFEDEQWTSEVIDPQFGLIQCVRSRGDSLFIGTPDYWLLRYQGTTQVLLEQGAYNFNYNTKENSWLILSSSSLVRYKNGSLESLVTGLAYNHYDYSMHSTLFRTSDRIFFSQNSPLQFYDLNTGEHQTILADSFNKDYTCIQSLIDHEGNLWIATLRGAFKVISLNAYSYYKSSLLEDEVTAVCVCGDEEIVLGTNNGFNVLNKNGQINKYPFKQGVKPRVMDVICRNAETLIGAYSLGLFSYQNGRYAPFSPQVPETDIMDIHLHNSVLYVATPKSLFRLDKDVWVKMLSLPRSSTYAVSIRQIMINDSVQYLLTSEGVYDLAQRRYYNAKAVENSNIYSGLFQNGKLMLGTFSGLMELQGDLIVPTEPAFNEAIYSLTLDDQNQLWMGTANGIFSQSGHLLNKSNGLSGNEVNRNAFQFLPSGQLITGTDEGVTFYKPMKIKYPELITEITAIKSRNGLITPDNPVISYSDNNLNFQFRAISYYQESLVNYRYQLVGFDEDWNNLKYHTQRSVTFTNLPAGQYEFQVQARLANGAWGPTATSYPLQITEAYYNTLVFRGIALVLIIILLVLVIRWRNQQLQKQNFQLEEAIKDKTQELHVQNEELIQTISNLKSTQGQLIQSEKLASMGHLTAGIAHEMNNPLNYIRGGAECLVKNLSEIETLHQKLLKNDGQPAADQWKMDYQYLIEESEQLAKTILQGAEKSTDIVKSLSSFTADGQSFFSFIDLVKEIDTALTLLNNQLGFRITVNKLLGNIPKIECYPAKVNQMLVNVLLNSIQAIPDQGEITIRVFRKEADHIGLEIIDTGIGIEHPEEAQVFEPFFTTKANNPGLGLTIVKAIVQEHNGSVEFSSVPGQGSSLLILLPIKQTFHPEIDELTEL